MNRKVLAVYYITSVMFLLVLLGLGAYQIRARLQRNLQTSQRSLEALRIAALSTYLAEGGFDTAHFRSTMREKSRGTPRLRLLAIYSAADGVQYLIADNRELLAVTPTADSAPPLSPQYDLRPLAHIRLSVPFSPGIRSALVIEGVFLRLEREDLYPILRESFYVVLVYLAVTTLLLLVAALSRSDPNRPEWKSASSRLGSPQAPGGSAHDLPPGSARSEPPAAPSEHRAGNPGLYSPETGLGWRDYLPQRLGHELERAASFDQDLALLLVAVTPQGPAVSSEHRSSLYRQLGKNVLESFPLRDLGFEYDPRTVAVILPDRSLDQGLEEARALQRKLLQASWPGPGRVRVCGGLSSRSGRLISGTRLLIEAGRSLKKAEAAGSNQIIAFRADPQKFRQVLFSGRED